MSTKPQPTCCRHWLPTSAEQPRDWKHACTLQKAEIEKKRSTWGDGISDEWLIHAAIRSVAWMDKEPTWELVKEAVEFMGITAYALYVPPAFRRFVYLPPFMATKALETLRNNMYPDQGE